MAAKSPPAFTSASSFPASFLGLGFRVPFGVGGRRLDPHQDVARAGLSLVAKLLLVLGVVRLEIAVGDGNARPKSGEIYEGVVEDTLLGNAIRFLRLFEAGLDLVLRHRDRSRGTAPLRPERTLP